MISTDLNTMGFRLELGEHIGERFVVRARDESDPVWPVRAVDVRDGNRPVQLAVRALGPWSFIKDAPASAGESVWSDTFPPGQIPVMTCPRLRHGGGVLEVAVTPDLPSALYPSPTPSSDTDGVNSPDSELDGDGGTTASVTVLRSLARLDRLYRATEAVEDLHASGLAHGVLDATSFRLSPDRRPYLRPVPEWCKNHDRNDPQNEQARDLGALHRLACQMLALGADVPDVKQAVDTYSPSNDHACGKIRRLIHKVVDKPIHGSADNPGIMSWRRTLDRLIRGIEAAWLTETARGHRRQLIGRLFAGDHDTVLADTDNSSDPWCIELAKSLRQRQALTADEYRQWQAHSRDFPLRTSAQQLVEIMERGYTMPEPPPIDALCRRLAGCAHHLREAAAEVRGRDWDLAHFSLIAASSLDPVNTALAGLSTLTADPHKHGKE